MDYLVYIKVLLLHKTTYPTLFFFSRLQDWLKLPLIDSNWSKITIAAAKTQLRKTTSVTRKASQ